MALFNVRVYGVLLDEEKRLLVSDEFIRGQYITKLPGGGLEIGEGTRDCLQREFKEEKDILGILGKKKALGPNPLSIKKKIKIGGSIFFLFF